jgi:hypothetical protein
MLNVEIKIKRGSLTLKPSHDDQLHLDADPPLVPELRGSTVLIDADGVGGPVHCTVYVPVPSYQLEANLGRGPCTVEGIEVKSGEVNLGMGDLVMSACRGKWDINVGKGDAALSGVSGTLDINVGMGRLEMSDISATGDINDGLGSITAIRCAGQYDVNAGKGDITWSQAQGGSLTANAGLGSTTVDGTGDALEIAAGLGKVSVRGAWDKAEVTTGRGDITVAGRFARLEATAKQRGNITVQLDSTAGARVEASTSRGRIVSHLNLIPVGHAGPQRGQRLVGVIGDGSGEVTLVTKNGDIMLSQREISEPLDTPWDVDDTPERRLAILQQLQEGALTIDEAEALLDGLEDND